MEKLFVVVRADLPPGAQVAQACHTLREFAAAHPELDRAWFGGGNNLVVLQLPTEAALVTLRERAAVAGVPVAECHEPDLGGQLTGIALGESAAKLVSGLPLALRAPRCQRCREVLPPALCVC